MESILVTGGCGYIGSHTVVELLNLDYHVVVLDNLKRSSAEVFNRIKRITGKEVVFYEADLLDKNKLEEIFTRENISAVVHFAGLKEAVAESPKKPLEYYKNNVVGTVTLIEVMKEHNCRNLVYSSSGIVYGKPQTVPITEKSPKGICPNPYGWTKSMVEQILMDIQQADKNWNIVILRYFNPIGAHQSGLIGENPNGIPSHLIPYVTQVALGKRDKLIIYGNDYDTPDGTGVRDYIHVVDVARGHVNAIRLLSERPGLKVYNLATGIGYSVFEIVKIFEEVTGRKIPYDIAKRRQGDISICYADPGLANKELGWSTEFDIRKMCEDSWRWQLNNPNGYE